MKKTAKTATKKSVKNAGKNASKTATATKAFRLGGVLSKAFMAVDCVSAATGGILGSVVGGAAIAGGALLGIASAALCFKWFG